MRSKAAGSIRPADLRWRWIVAAVVTCALACPAAFAGNTPVVVQSQVIAVVTKPLMLTYAPGDPTRMFVAEVAGRIRVIRDGVLLPTPFLDMTSRVAPQIGERGLKCMAFHPDYLTNGYFYVIFMSPSLQTTISRFQRDPSNPDLALLSSEKIILTETQLNPNHNGDWVGFGPDGYLYASLGDGANFAHSQDVNIIQGKILRLDVNVPEGGQTYAIPPDNPFVGIDGRDEVWAYGLRNPWRLSFDRLTGDLWIGDVGAQAREELNFQPADSPGGENYGWPCQEGMICGAAWPGCVCPEGDYVPPVFDYPHTVGRAIVAGHVYRGSEIPGLQGLFVYCDVFTGKLWSYDPVTQERRAMLTNHPGAVYSMGEDFHGELYYMGPNWVLKILHEPDCDGDGVDDATAVAQGLVDDCNENGLPDSCDLALGNSLDLNETGVPDECENDCNGNGVDDLIDIAQGTSLDCDGDEVPDECQIAAGASDCDSDGMLDLCEIAQNPRLDADGSGVLDACELLGDVNRDHAVDGLDLGIVLANWSIPPTAPGCGGASICPADINQDGVVNGLDLGFVLADWTG